jgi:hypothetical protein
MMQSSTLVRIRVVRIYQKEFISSTDLLILLGPQFAKTGRGEPAKYLLISQIPEICIGHKARK